MNRFLLLFILCLPLHTYAQQTVQQMSYEQWLQEAKTDDTLLPRFGDRHHTKQHLAEDSQYVATTLNELQADRHSGSEQMVMLGFSYYHQGDMPVAMLRFNQAWLLDSLNPSVYGGYGAIYMQFGDNETAMKYYDEGLSLNPGNTNLLTDKATLYMIMSARKPDTTLTGKAFRLLMQSFALEPKQPSTSYMLSRYYMLQNNCDSAVRYYNICKKDGGPMITEKYTAALKKRCSSLDTH